ncbi:transcription-repair coupling factor [Alkalicoccus urumqiensis]|uniref:Transcription-repair-coupling factor n=1 Tax=Alkalicoccus urumqiensis TaxID=1548213 RepID=A0A2P6MDN8_ALKUR|nr:transcription-repair coupling factor [Alkalicoccus urumqiensis]PRO64395.1 transcription-repair coupling factor [Alkalicoccus urumqiensis]
MRGLLEQVKEAEDIQTALSESGDQLISGVTGSARAFLAAAAYEKTGRSQLVVAHNLLQAQKMHDDLATLLGEEHVFLYPVNELISAEVAVASPELRGQRIEALNHWAAGKNGILVTPAAGMRRLLPPPEKWKTAQVTIEQGKDLDTDHLFASLAASGFHRNDMVGAPGEFSVRGGIIDIYPLTESHPVRIELFDTEVDSLRYFDVESQRSLEQIEEIVIGPAREILLEEKDFERGAGELEKKLSDSLKTGSDDTLNEQLSEYVRGEIEQLRQKQTFDSMYKYMSLFYEKTYTLLDYFPEDASLIVDEPSRVLEVIENLEREEADWQTTMLSQGHIPREITMSISWDDVMHAKMRKVYFSLFVRQIPGTTIERNTNLQTKSMQQFHGQMNVLQPELKRWKENQSAVIFACADEERAERLQRVLHDYDMEAAVVKPDTPPAYGQAQIVPSVVGSGFELPLEKLVLITEEEVFTKKTPKKPKRRTQKLSNAERIKSYSELNVGDWVVHVNHGIGKYLGIETLQVGDVHKDYMHISYAGNDKLYVPVEQIDQVQKYVGSDEKEPKLYSLGGSEWKKVKSRVRNSVQDIADDLIKLYAEREQSRGHAFSRDSIEQQEFEAAFPYQETEDQIRAIGEIKEDMERGRPMDRLLCGDVGYGKTEVALRAAFKALMDGKQVAILVPTTILAQQHYETIRERFQDFPVNTALLSRFRTRKQIKETSEGLKKGSIDIVVGTHRLLSKDIEFNELGLLVVDEEQRFGVTHKEKIKQLKANVDVLTLTATPIPRTLHMSMLGVRDLSVIETPPENRFPVQTYVVEYNDALTREAIERELARGGQVFLLYNRVEDIESVADRISMLVPDASVRFAHGRMTETELESVMVDFLEGEADVLVTTTIIETGVDIPNVNTLIIHNADRMGLSQLYQLRGRVGRSSRIAYAYFTHQRDKVLSEVAEHRLQSMKEFTELGSGFKIAMRDLSIRGAGNLLGAEQHGFIASVGFDLYSQMLKEAIDERKEEIDRKAGKEPEQPKAPELELDIQVDAYLPESYIPDSRQKIDMYKRFRGLQTMEELRDLQDEMIDRFGEYPDEVDYLFSVSKIKLLARDYGVEKVSEKQQVCRMSISEEMTSRIDGSKLFTLVNKLSRHLSLAMEGKQITVHLKTKPLDDGTYLSLLVRVLEQLPDVRKDEPVNA